MPGAPGTIGGLPGEPGSASPAGSSSGDSSDGDSDGDGLPDGGAFPEGSSPGEGYPSGSASTGGSESAGASGSAFPGGDGSGGVLSSEEQVAVLDGELDSSIAVFDGMILDERGVIRGVEDANPEQLPGGGGVDEPLFEEGDLTEESGQEAAVPPAPSGGTVAGEGDSQQGSQTRSGSSSGPVVETARADGGVPPDLIDGSDDDIVARQIREAAMKETDPVLKEKLWEEYRKYKNRGNVN